MNWEKFHKNLDRIRANCNEFTDDIIRVDGTLDVQPGSDTDMNRYDQEEIEEFCKNTGLVYAPVHEVKK